MSTEVTELPSKVNTRSLMEAFASGSLEQLVEIAACARVAAERNYGAFCSQCGRRIGDQHARACSFYEETDVVRGFDAVDVAGAIDKRAIAIRSRA